MIHRALKIGRWTADFLFAESRYDIDGVVACLREIRAPSRVIAEAVDLMESDGENTGFLYNNRDEFRALGVVGPSSSGAEFIDTLVHEIHHLAVAIADGLGVDLEGETPAYIAGDAARDFAEVVCTLGCPHCREDK